MTDLAKKFGRAGEIADRIDIGATKAIKKRPDKEKCMVAMSYVVGAFSAHVAHLEQKINTLEKELEQK